MALYEAEAIGTKSAERIILRSLAEVSRIESEIKRCVVGIEIELACRVM